MEAYYKKMYELVHFNAAYRGSVLQLSATTEGFEYKGQPETRKITFAIHNLTAQPKAVIVNGEQLIVKKDLTGRASWDGETLSVQGKLQDKLVVEVKM